MYARHAFASALLVFLASLSTSSPAAAAEVGDQKDTCLAAADAGQSLRDDGQYSVAREQFVACARDVCPKLVHDQCTDWLRQLDEATPTVVFSAKDDHGNDVVGSRILLDGRPVASTLGRKPVAVDPGPHDVRFEHDPNEAVTMHVVVRAGEKNREVSATFAVPDASAQTPHEESTPEPGAPEGESEPSSPSSSSGRTIASLSLLGGGVVAGAVGVFFGLQAQSESDQAVVLRNGLPSRSACTNPDLTNQTVCTKLSNERDASNRDSVVSDALYVTGGALAVAAAATWLLWPKRQEEPVRSAWVAPVVGPTHAGIGIGGAF